LGEPHTFNVVSGNNAHFLDNLIFYIANAAKYGSHFQDLFIEDGEPDSVPAPWDSHWEPNTGVPEK
jgi:hypothetical protein